MNLIELSKEEFETFAKHHPYANFYQTTAWGELKEENQWKMYLLGLQDDNQKLRAGSLLLSKTTPIHKNMFYAPRGFLIDYEDFALLKEFTEKVKDFVKQHDGIFIKIDPYVSYQEHDLEGNIVEGGENHFQAFKNLEKLGYKHFGFNLMQDTLQPRWMFTTTTKERSIEEVMKEMDPRTRQIIRKNEKACIRTREIDESELETFKNIMQHTGDRREFIDRPLSYYQNMYRHLGKKGIMKIQLAELHAKEYLKELVEEKNQAVKEMEERRHKFEDGNQKVNEKKYQQKQKETENNIERLEHRIDKISQLQEQHGDVIPLGGILFLLYGKEIISLVGGSYKEFMEFQSTYTSHWEMMKYAIENNFERYNFYGITGDFREENPLYGLYLFKKGFGGQVVELLGEFDLVVNKKDYMMYKTAFKLYRTQKNFAHKLETILKK